MCYLQMPSIKLLVDRGCFSGNHYLEQCTCISGLTFSLLQNFQDLVSKGKTHKSISSFKKFGRVGIPNMTFFKFVSYFQSKI